MFSHLSRVVFKCWGFELEILLPPKIQLRPMEFCLWCSVHWKIIFVIQQQSIFSKQCPGHRLSKDAFYMCSSIVRLTHIWQLCQFCIYLNFIQYSCLHWLRNSLRFALIDRKRIFTFQVYFLPTTLTLYWAVSAAKTFQSAQEYCGWTQPVETIRALKLLRCCDVLLSLSGVDDVILWIINRHNCQQFS